MGAKSTTTRAEKYLRFPLRLILAGALITMGLVIWDSWADYRDSLNDVAVVGRAAKTGALAARILHLDEVLTMSARMAVATGDKAWVDRYRKFEPELDSLIKEAGLLALTGQGTSQALVTDKANEDLVRLENASFELVLQGKKQEAWALLTGPEYEQQKHIYAAAMAEFVKAIETHLLNESAGQHRSDVVRAIARSVATLILFGLWSFTMWRITMAWRTKAEQHRALADSLRGSEQQYRTLFESSRDALMTKADMAGPQGQPGLPPGALFGAPN